MHIYENGESNRIEHILVNRYNHIRSGPKNNTTTNPNSHNQNGGIRYGITYSDRCIGNNNTVINFKGLKSEVVSITGAKTENKKDLLNFSQ